MAKSSFGCELSLIQQCYIGAHEKSWTLALDVELQVSA